MKPVTLCKLVLACLTITPVFSQSFGYLKIADSSTPRPDGQGTFFINLQPRPAIEGNRVLFHEPGTNAAIWSFDLTTGSFLKLVDFRTPVPGGVGTFTSFSPQDSQPLLKGGTVVFLGWDSSGARFSQGLYTVPAGGGPVTRVIDTRTASPTGGTFRQIDESSKPFGAFSIDAGRIAFSALNNSGFGGVYSANIDGSGLTRLMDNTTPFRPNPQTTTTIVGGTNPWISGNTVAFWGGNGFDPSSGYNGIYTVPTTGGTPVERMNSLLRLPGISAATYHTRVLIPTVQLEGQTIVFSADDTFAPAGFRGLYLLSGSGAPTVIADGVTALPSLGPFVLPSSFNSFSLNNGRVLFRVQDTAFNSALFLWQNGTVNRVIGTGDIIDGRRVSFVVDLSPGALAGDRFAFLVDFGPQFGPAIYAAVPPGDLALNALQNGASYSLNQVTPGGVVTLYGSGMGPAELATFQLDASQRIPTSLAGTRILFNGVPAPLLYVSATQASAIAPYSLDGQTSAQVVVQSQGRVSAALTVAVKSADPGLFSANRQGTGPGAILNQDGTLNSDGNPAAPNSVVVLFGTGFGPTNPLATDGQLTSSTNPPRLRDGLTVTIGGLPATVEYGGPAPGAVAGLYQVNVRIPPSALRGNLPIKVTIGTSASQDGLTVAVGGQ